jgi:hypothetical protein
MKDRGSALSGNVVLLGLALWAGFIPFIFIFPRQELFELLNAVVFAIATGVVVGYAPGVWQALKSDIRDLRSGDALQIGIAIAWLATACVFSVMWWWRLTGKESTLIDHGFTAFSRWMLITAGFLHLAASGSVDGRVPLRSYLRAGVMTAIGILLGIMAITFAHGTIDGL